MDKPGLLQATSLNTTAINALELQRRFHPGASEPPLWPLECGKTPGLSSSKPPFASDMAPVEA